MQFKKVFGVLSICACLIGVSEQKSLNALRSHEETARGGSLAVLDESAIDRLRNFNIFINNLPAKRQLNDDFLDKRKRRKYTKDNDSTEMPNGLHQLLDQYYDNAVAQELRMREIMEELVLRSRLDEQTKKAPASNEDDKETKYNEIRLPEIIDEPVVTVIRPNDRRRENSTLNMNSNKSKIDNKLNMPMSLSKLPFISNFQSFATVPAENIFQLPPRPLDLVTEDDTIEYLKKLPRDNPVNFTKLFASRPPPPPQQMTPLKINPSNKEPIPTVAPTRLSSESINQQLYFLQLHADKIKNFYDVFERSKEVFDASDEVQTSAQGTELNENPLLTSMQKSESDLQQNIEKNSFNNGLDVEVQDNVKKSDFYETASSVSSSQSSGPPQIEPLDSSNLKQVLLHTDQYTLYRIIPTEGSKEHFGGAGEVKLWVKNQTEERGTENTDTPNQVQISTPATTVFPFAIKSTTDTMTDKINLSAEKDELKEIQQEKFATTNTIPETTTVQTTEQPSGMPNEINLTLILKDSAEPQVITTIAPEIEDATEFPFIPFPNLIGEGSAGNEVSIKEFTATTEKLVETKTVAANDEEFTTQANEISSEDLNDWVSEGITEGTPLSSETTTDPANIEYTTEITSEIKNEKENIVLRNLEREIFAEEEANRSMENESQLNDSTEELEDVGQGSERDYEMQQDDDSLEEIVGTGIQDKYIESSEEDMVDSLLVDDNVMKDLLEEEKVLDDGKEQEIDEINVEENSELENQEEDLDAEQKEMLEKDQETEEQLKHEMEQSEEGATEDEVEGKHELANVQKNGEEMQYDIAHAIEQENTLEAGDDMEEREEHELKHDDENEMEQGVPLEPENEEHTDDPGTETDYQLENSLKYATDQHANPEMEHEAAEELPMLDLNSYTDSINSLMAVQGKVSIPNKKIELKSPTQEKSDTERQQIKMSANTKPIESVNQNFNDNGTIKSNQDNTNIQHNEAIKRNEESKLINSKANSNNESINDGSEIMENYKSSNEMSALQQVEANATIESIATTMRANLKSLAAPIPADETLKLTTAKMSTTEKKLIDITKEQNSQTYDARKDIESGHQQQDKNGESIESELIRADAENDDDNDAGYKESNNENKTASKINYSEVKSKDDTHINDDDDDGMVAQHSGIIYMKANQNANNDKQIEENQLQRPHSSMKSNETNNKKSNNNKTQINDTQSFSNQLTNPPTITNVKDINLRRVVQLKDNQFQTNNKQQTGTAREVTAKLQRSSEPDNSVATILETKKDNLATNQTTAFNSNLQLMETTTQKANKPSFSETEIETTNWWNTLPYAEIRKFLNTIFDSVIAGNAGDSDDVEDDEDSG